MFSTARSPVPHSILGSVLCLIALEMARQNAIARLSVMNQQQDIAQQQDMVQQRDIARPRADRSDLLQLGPHGLKNPDATPVALPIRPLKELK